MITIALFVALYTLLCLVVFALFGLVNEIEK